MYDVCIYVCMYVCMYGMCVCFLCGFVCFFCATKSQAERFVWEGLIEFRLFVRMCSAGNPSPNPFLTLHPGPSCCSVQTRVQSGPPRRCQRVYRNLTNWGLLRGSAWANRGLGSGSRHSHGVHVLACIRLQPGPVKLGRVIRH